MSTALAPERPSPVDSALSTQIIETFYSRTDVFPFQWWHPGRSIGGYAKACKERPPWMQTRCKHKTPGKGCTGCEFFAPIPVEPRIIDMHLKGAITIGSYQLAQDGTGVRWAVLDFDDHGESKPQELQDDASVIRQALESMGLPCAMEASGGTGWRCHLWLFFGGLVPAIKARVILDYVLEYTACGDRPYIERFPKQSRALNGYGNLVKIPFGVHRKTGNRSSFLDPESLTPISLAEALQGITLIDPITVDAIIDLKHIELRELPSGEAAPAKDFNCPTEEMHKVLTRCWWFREIEQQQLNADYIVHYEDWWNYILMLSRFGEAGAERILAFSSYDDRFDRDYTVNMVNYIRQHGYHAPSCRRLREGPGQIHCPYDPMECGAQ